LIKEKVKHQLRRFPWLKKALKYALGIEAANRRFFAREQKMIEQELRQTVGENTAGKTARIPLLNFGDDRPALFSRPISQAATSAQMQEPEYAEWCHRLHDRPNFHRKHWEYVYILKALDQAGKIGSGMKGLGFGVGKDPIVAYLAKHGCELLATDLDPANAFAQGWATTNQYSAKLYDLNERGICTNRVLQKQVRLQNVNMNEIPDELTRGEFDFVWSACAFEHLGTLELGLQFVLNSMKCLKPGGIAIHTTEFNISSNDETIAEGGTVVYRKRDFEELAQRLRAERYQLELNFNLGTQAFDQHYDVAPYKEYHHLRLQLARYVITSYGLIISKPAL
jgi:2-polyprenyl-3-methyl-5-hydroxy-6-metoxy-1,4-benzoquinol methylase